MGGVNENRYALRRAVVLRSPVLGDEPQRFLVLWRGEGGRSQEYWPRFAVVPVRPAQNGFEADPEFFHNDPRQFLELETIQTPQKPAMAASVGCATDALVAVVRMLAGWLLPRH
jgi:hypothetical protein